MAYCQSYTPDYFALNDILSTEERVSCKIEIELLGLGFLDSSSTSRDLKVGSKVEFPLWLAESLKNLKDSIVSIDIPNIYKEGYREILEADADAIVLSKWNPFYYEIGMHVRKFNDRDSEQITESLLQTFKSRFRLVMDWAQNPISDPTLVNQLPRLERDLFLIGRKAKVRLLEWLKGDTNNIISSEITTNLKKRKRAQFELN
ncbi:DNA replication complex GINS protein PSF3 [Apis mellifera caucasica]|uniref:DNA replication complex GINS protein PSF3 n=1 Tax=Apis mellifera TaxID=7460 RepID=A0A7M7MNJ1_APIME|nr:DNA replication complex GINS protein PSF3 [Apis mellifera]KAG6804637.1 DNA replication complex GINS protein PSF3 [Apis mellifera caucasica]KAG9431450.1 DNA replication complex GINS protein PSF3 [Apis mellifera carnica]|eukprot:XP_026298627.1 DNA replication complex GINS protein PSF3 [Apis mellifera]